MYLNKLNEDFIMKLYPNSVNVADVVAFFAENGTTDGIQVFNDKGRSVGYLTDLKIKYCQKQNAKATVKKSSKIRREKLKEAASIMAEEMVLFLQSEVPNGVAFINETMPNIDIKGQRIYLIVGDTLERSIRLNIRHSEYTYEDIDDMVIGYTAKAHDASDPRNVMFSGLSKEDAVFIINQLAAKL
ncbi:hypothetical protein [Citrobacter phage Ci1]|nr:hypothetical protein [Citrobacter phage Ci1]